jgi:hypothetical protein
MKKFFTLTIISILITLIFGLIKVTERSPYPDFTQEPTSETGVVATFSTVNGGGFPLMWWRQWPGINPGEVHMTVVFRNIIGFVGDIIFWFITTWIAFRVIRKINSITGSAK